MEKTNYFNEWGQSWPVAALLAILLAFNIIFAGVIGAVVSGVIDMLNQPEIGEDGRYFWWATGIALAVMFPIGLNRSMRSYYRREFQDEVAAARREAYALGRDAAAAPPAAN